MQPTSGHTHLRKEIEHDKNLINSTQLVRLNPHSLLCLLYCNDNGREVIFLPVCQPSIHLDNSYKVCTPLHAGYSTQVSDPTTGLMRIAKHYFLTVHGIPVRPSLTVA